MPTSQSTKASDLNTIRGKVTLKESGAGIPDLLVVIYDLDPGTKSEESSDNPDPTIARMAQPSPNALQADRLGSVITAQDGTWLLSYADSEYRVANPAEKRPTCN